MSTTSTTDEVKASANGHKPEAVEDLARAIIDDVLSPDPTYRHTVNGAGIYSKDLAVLIKVRKQQGRAAAQATYEDLKTNKPLFKNLAVSPRKAPPQVVIPPLPDPALWLISLDCLGSWITVMTNTAIALCPIIAQ